MYYLARLTVISNCSAGYEGDKDKRHARNAWKAVNLPNVPLMEGEPAMIERRRQEYNTIGPHSTELSPTSSGNDATTT